MAYKAYWKWQKKKCYLAKIYLYHVRPRAGSGGGSKFQQCRQARKIVTDEKGRKSQAWKLSGQELQDLGDQLHHQSYGANIWELFRAAESSESFSLWQDLDRSPCILSMPLEVSVPWGNCATEGPFGFRAINWNSWHVKFPGKTEVLSWGQGLGDFPATLYSFAHHYSLCFLALVVGTPPRVSPGFPFC